MPAARHSLDPIFRPLSVAVLGADASPGGLGGLLLRNLTENPFRGPVFLIDPNRPAVQGVSSYPDLASVPGTVDLAVLAAPAGAVPGLLAGCVARGVRAAILLSAGSPGRGEGGDIERQVRAARGTMRVLGPTSLGVLHPPSNLNASFAAMPRPGRVALLSQSGAIGASLLDWARASHVGFSSVVGIGAMLDVDFADLIDYFAEDPATRSIILFAESTGDARKFLSAARGASRAKPVLVVKAGRRQAGPEDVFDAAFRRAGVLRVGTIPDLFNLSEILAMQPLPRGPALALVTNAGGPALMAADSLLAQGGQLAALAPQTLAALDEALPAAWGRANPVDLLADATPQRYRAAVEAVARDPDVQGVLVLLTPRPLADPTETARQLVGCARGAGKPLLACWLGGPAVREGRDLLNRAGIPTFDSPESAARAFLHMVQFRRNQELLYETPASLPEDWQPDPGRAREALRAARAEGRTLLNESEAREVLAAYGIPVGQAVGSRTGYELTVGSRVDPQFGPLIGFGPGGALAEALGERALALPPLNRTLARRLMERTKVYQALRKARGHGAVRLEELETLLVRFSQLLCDFPEVQEVELNPVLATPDRVLVLAARVVLAPADRPDGLRPRLAIHPYPNQYTAPFRLRDGTEVAVRAIRPEDEPLIIALHGRHSPQTIRMRFFSMVKSLSHESLIRLCHLDYDREMALAAVKQEEGGARILGVSRYHLDPETGEAEFALVVEDAYQGKGLGRHLLGRLIAIARERGVKKLVGLVLAENTPMLALTRSLGFGPPRPVEDGVVRVEMVLAE